MAEETRNPVTVGVPKETYPGESRVAMAPSALPGLTKAKVQVLIESGAGTKAGFVDEAYKEKGARIVESREDVFAADVVLMVRTYGASPEAGKADLELLRPGQVIAGLSDPLVHPQAIAEMAGRKATVFAMEMIPRITRAQSMDVLSSQANIGGYKAVLLAAEALTKMFPMMTTAAGTIPPAKVFILGAGVAGLQAIATAKRLGAVVEAFDVRPEVKEQVQSLGGKFVEVPLDTEEASGTGGYAKEQSENFLKRQRELLSKTIAASDVVITTAQVPGKKAPVLVTEEMVKGMSPGSVIVDMAAGQGGNVEPSRPDEIVDVNGVKIIGPTNLPATVAFDASAMYAKNVATLLLHLLKEGSINLDTDDEIIREAMVATGGEVVHPRIREALGLAPAPAPVAPEEKSPAPAAEQSEATPTGA